MLQFIIIFGVFAEPEQWQQRGRNNKLKRYPRLSVRGVEVEPRTGQGSFLLLATKYSLLVLLFIPCNHLLHGNQPVHSRRGAIIVQRSSLMQGSCMRPSVVPWSFLSTPKMNNKIYNRKINARAFFPHPMPCHLITRRYLIRL